MGSPTVPPGLVPAWGDVTPPARAINTPYVWDGEPYPRVTDIIKVWHQPELHSWMRRLSAEVALQRDPPPEGRFQQDLRLCLAEPYRIRDDAASRGTDAHRLLHEYLLTGESPNPYPLAMGPLFEAGRAFVDRWVSEVLLMELPVYNRTYQYAGTPDLFCQLADGRIACVDWKSGGGVYRHFALQLAAYVNAEWVDLGGSAEEMPEAEVGWIVHLDPEEPEYPHGFGVWEVPSPRDRPWRAFRACRTLYHHLETEHAHLGRIM